MTSVDLSFNKPRQNHSLEKFSNFIRPRIDSDPSCALGEHRATAPLGRRVGEMKGLGLKSLQRRGRPAHVVWPSII